MQKSPPPSRGYGKSFFLPTRKFIQAAALWVRADEGGLRCRYFDRLEALLDAGIMRLRPVMITVGATVIALFPLASHGGPLWEPMCYAQIGGLSVATFITLLLVPVIYAIFVLDLKLVKWEKAEEKPDTDAAHAPATT